MDEDNLNIEIRKFLKQVGISSQREIENYIRKKFTKGSIKIGESIKVFMNLIEISNCNEHDTLTKKILELHPERHLGLIKGLQNEFDSTLKVKKIEKIIENNDIKRFDYVIERKEFNLHNRVLHMSSNKYNFYMSKCLIDLKADVDIIILLTSSGVPWDRDKIYNDFVSNYKKTGTINENLNSIELGYFADEVDLIISGGISKGYNTPWYDKNSHTYIFQNYGNGTSFGHFYINFHPETKLFTGYKSAVTNSISQTLFLDNW